MCLFALLASIAKDAGRWTKRGSRKKGWRKGVRDGRFKHSNCDTDVGRGRQRMESSRDDMKADGEMPCSRACRMLTTRFHLRLQTLFVFISFDDAGTSRFVDRGRRGAARHSTIKTTATLSPTSRMLTARAYHTPVLPGVV